MWWRLGFDWVTKLTLIALPTGCGLLVAILCKKYDASWFVRRIFFQYAHEVVVKNWIDKELSNVSVCVKFTEGALEFFKAKRARECSVLITFSRRYVRSRMGSCSFPYAEVRLSVVDPSEDFFNVESNVGIPVLVAREIYEMFKQVRIPLIVATSASGNSRN